MPSPAKMEFMLTDQNGELFKAGKVGVYNGEITPVMDGHEILHNVRTHEMSGFKLTPEYADFDIEQVDCLKLSSGRTIYD